MISGDELAFVRLAMRRRLLNADEVREAVERKRWDAPRQGLPSILVDMGALERGQADALRQALVEGARGGRQHMTLVGRDPAARETKEELDEDEEAGPRIPEVIANYKLTRLLGAGAMGAVYLARNQALEREVALKLLMAEGAPSPRAVQRFRREARLTARLEHPNIVRVYEAGQDKGYHYIAMDLVRGMSVQELIALGDMPFRRAVYVMRRVAEAVGYAHEQEVIHRDLKPANILVDEATGEARVTDFGLAVLSEGGEDDRLTRTGAAVGTPAYMAPEQVRGQLDRIDGRTDIYSLGATFYEMLTGSPPFDATTFLELAKKICDQSPVRPRRRNPALPVDVETICLKALEKDPANRYQTAGEMAADLAAFLGDQEITAQRPPLHVRFGRWARRRPMLVAGALGFLAVLLGGSVYHLSLPGVLLVASQPAGATVLVDGRPLGETPASGELRLELSAGDHELEFGLTGYLPHAAGVERVHVGNGETHRLTATLVSAKGVLRVTTTPPGADVIVERAQGSGEPVHHGTAPLLVSLESGAYVVRLRAAGFLSPAPERVEVARGGAETALTLALEPDPAALVLTADPENVSIRWDRDAGSYAAPVELRGAGDHDVLATKAGYLPRRLRVRVPPQTRVARRVNLAPLVAARRPLGGELLARPLARDVDADGAPDLVVLERGDGGAQLALYRGGGHVGADYRVPVRASALIDAVDLDADGVLDLVLGDAERLELRDGRSGALLAPPVPLDASAVAVVAGLTPPQLVYLGPSGQVTQVDLDLAIGRRRLPPASGRPPALLRVGGGTPGRGPGDLAIFAQQDAVLVWSISDRRSRGSIAVPGATSTSQVLAAQTARGLDPQVALVPPSGPARLIDLTTGATLKLGDADDRFSAAAAALTDAGGVLLLTDARRGRARVFRLRPDQAVEQGEVARDPLVLEDREQVVLWCPSGDAYAFADGAFVRDEEGSTDPEVWVSRDSFELALVEDLDGDGRAEVVAPSTDRRSLVYLSPRAAALRWRRRAQPGPIAVLPNGAEADLLLVDGARLRGFSGADGRELFSVELPGPLAAGGQGERRSRGALTVDGQQPGRRALYAAVQAEEPLLIQLLEAAGGQGGGQGWEEGWRVARASGGVFVIADEGPDQDGRGDVLLGGPLARLASKDGRQQWSDPKDRAEPGQSRAGYLPGKASLCVGAARSRRGVLLLVGYGPSGDLLWERELPDPSGVEGPPEQLRAIHGGAGLPFLVALTDRRALCLQRTDGALLWERALVEVVGAALSGGAEPRLVLSHADGTLLGLSPSGEPVWLRQLPGGEGQASAPVLLAREAVGEEALAVVAPSGALVFVAASDGAYLGERRSPERELVPAPLGLLPGGGGDPALPPGLAAFTANGRLLVFDVERLLRPRPDRRVRIGTQQRRLAAGEPLASRALEELQVLVSEDPSDPTALLVLAKGLLVRGNAKEALATVERALPLLRERAGGRAPADAARLHVEATFAIDPSPARIEPLLAEVASNDRQQAAQVALDLARRGALNGGDPEPFLRLATRFDPASGEARRRLGLHLLRTVIPERPVPSADMTDTQLVVQANDWRNLPPKSQGRVRARVAVARAELLLSLSAEDHPEGRAGALVAAALERQLLRASEGARAGIPEVEVLDGVIEAMIGAVETREQPPLLARAIQLARASTLQEARAAARALHELERGWTVPLAGVAALGW